MAGPFYAHTRGIDLMASSPNGKLVASISSHDAIKIWNVEMEEIDLEPIALETYFSVCVAFSPDGKMLVSGGSWHHEIIIWDIETGNTIAGPIECHTSVKSLVFSPDGKRYQELETSEDELKHLKSEWVSPVYAFYYPVPHIGYHEEETLAEEFKKVLSNFGLSEKGHAPPDPKDPNYKLCKITSDAEVEECVTWEALLRDPVTSNTEEADSMDGWVDEKTALSEAEHDVIEEYLHPVQLLLAKVWKVSFKTIYSSTGLLLFGRGFFGSVQILHRIKNSMWITQNSALQT
ncbi:hypothetical protein BDQ17DRAFT_1437308 [Cyathus striatus]|nr:hypothetical protein BDQ17DRAFT_1437308 [Cyathus striatus]